MNIDTQQIIDYIMKQPQGETRDAATQGILDVIFESLESFSKSDAVGVKNLVIKLGDVISPQQFKEYYSKIETYSPLKYSENNKLVFIG